MMPKDPIKAEETRKRLSESHKGKTPWNKGKVCPEISERQMGEKNHMFGTKGAFFGKHHTEENKKILSEKHVGIHKGEKSPLWKPKVQKTCPICKTIFDVKPSHASRRVCCSKECFNVLSISILTNRWNNPEEREKFIHTGEKSHLWKGGISFEPYCEKFNREFKERSRQWYGYTCVECGTPQNGTKLDIHHVNYDKMVCCNDVKPMFVALCRGCNTRANFNKEYWEPHFTKIINEYYGGKCYLTKEESIALQGGFN